MENRCVLITGCAGRVGAALAEELAKNNEVHGIDVADGVARENLEQAGIVYHKMRLGRDTLDELPDHFDYVYHQAVTWTVRNHKEEREAYLVSVKGVVELLKKYRNADRFLLASTGGVCAPSTTPVTEEEVRRPDATPYHSYKFGMEIVSEAIAETEGQDVVVLRYYWPWSRHNGFPHSWVIVPQLRGEPVSVCFETPNLFTPLFMPDCVRYSIELAELPSVPRIVNVGGTEVVSIEDMARISADILGIVPEFTDTRGQMPVFLGDAARLVKLLGPPEYDVRRSIESSIEWHREHPKEHLERTVFDAPGNW